MIFEMFDILLENAAIIITTLAVFAIVYYVVRSLLEARKLSGKIIALLFALAIPGLIQYTMVEVSQSIYQGMLESSPFITDTKDIMLDMLVIDSDGQIGEPATFSGGGIAPTAEMTVEDVPLPKPVAIPESTQETVVIQETPTPTYIRIEITPTAIPTLNLDTWNPSTPPPTPGGN